MNKFEKELKQHYEEKIEYNYGQFDEISKKLNLVKKNPPVSKRMKLKPIFASAIILVVAFVSFFGGYKFMEYTGDNGFTAHPDKIEEKLSQYADNYLISPICTKTFSNEMNVVIYIGTEIQTENPILILNFNSPTLTDILEVQVGGAAYTYKISDYSDEDNNNWDYIVIDRADQVEVSMTFRNITNETYSDSANINVNNYLYYIENRR